MSYNDKNHLFGRIFLAIAIVIIIAIPVVMAIVLQALPNITILISALLSLAVFIIGGFIEVVTYAPMLGTTGTYLGFFTGNLANLKLPCAVNAREVANVKHGSKEGEIVSTVSIATSTIVTTLIMAIGVVLLVPLTPVLENPTLTPAFSSAFTALFGALAYKYFTKDPKLVPIPLVLAIVLETVIPGGLGTSILIPLCSVVAILFGFYLFKLAKKKENN